MSKIKLKVLSRLSPLALKQVDEVSALFPELDFDVILMDSYGDKHKDISLIDNPAVDIFTRELDNVLLAGDCDIAIHSAKDLPYPIPDGLELIALFDAFDKSDSLVTKGNLKLNELPVGARVGTSSSARKEQLIQLRPDLKIVSIRGTIEERIAQVDNNTVDALIVASCALTRLGIENRASEKLTFKTHPLQGNLGIIARKDETELKRIFSKYDIQKDFGKVSLVGNGPGNKDLLTIKAYKRLKHADLIVYDDLIDNSILDDFDAKRVYVGKRSGNHSMNQDEINELLYVSALSYKNIVRLKGGDPSIFGHLAEEIYYLESRFISVNIIPGITSALGAAAAAKFPLTVRNLSNSVAFCTAHDKLNIPLPKTDTLVYYMGAANLTHLAKTLIEDGRSPDTPITLVYNVGNTDEKIFSETLLSASISERKYPTPLVIIVGVGGNKSNFVKAFKAEPKILYTGTQPEKYLHLGNITHYPLIEIIDNPLNTLNNNLIDSINNINWLIFTSKYAVHFFFKYINQQGYDTRNLNGIKICSIGKVTSMELTKYGINPDLQPQNDSSEGIINLFREKKIVNRNILIPRSDIALSILPDGLKSLGNSVQTINIYCNIKPINIKKIDIDKFDKIVFTSPSGVKNFFSIYDTIPGNVKIITRGIETQKTLDNEIRKFSPVPN